MIKKILKERQAVVHTQQQSMQRPGSGQGTTYLRDKDPFTAAGQRREWSLEDQEAHPKLHTFYSQALYPNKNKNQPTKNHIPENEVKSLITSTPTD